MAIMEQAQEHRPDFPKFLTVGATNSSAAFLSNSTTYFRKRIER